MHISKNQFNRYEIDGIQDVGLDNPSKKGVAGYHGKFQNLIGWLLTKPTFTKTVKVKAENGVYYLNCKSIKKLFLRINPDHFQADPHLNRNIRKSHWVKTELERLKTELIVSEIHSHAKINTPSPISKNSSKDSSSSISIAFEEKSPVLPSPSLKTPQTWPINPTCDSDFNMVLAQANTEDEKEKLIATAPIDLIKMLLKNNFFDNYNLLWKQMLPYLSDQQLHELSLADFNNELQLAIALIGKNNRALEASKTVRGIFQDSTDVSTNSPNGSNFLAESRRRFALVASGLEVKMAIENGKLSKTWLGYLSAEELHSAFTFKELIDQQLIEDAFSYDVMAHSPLCIPEEKLRFEGFSSQEIVAYLENLKLEDYNHWLYGEYDKINEHHFFENFQHLLSREHLKFLDFSKLKLGQMALAIGQRWKERYDELDETQKEAIFQRIKPALDHIQPTPCNCNGLLMIGHQWKEEKEKRR